MSKPVLRFYLWDSPITEFPMPGMLWNLSMLILRVYIEFVMSTKPPPEIHHCLYNILQFQASCEGRKACSKVTNYYYLVM
jgi:hypothetical protein